MVKYNSLQKGVTRLQSNIKIKLASHENVDSWMELIEKLKGFFPGLETKKEIDEYQNTVNQFIGKNHAICALDGQKVVGFILFSTSQNMLCHMAVHPDYRRIGIASKMISEMLKYLDLTRDVEVITFREDDEKGKAARELYMSFGFVPGELVNEMNYPEQKFVLHPKL